MTIRCTKASAKEAAGTVTIRTSEIVRELSDGEVIKWNPEPGFYIANLRAKRGKKVYPTVMWPNRKDGTTMKTTVWPEQLKEPQVGEPVEVEIEEIHGPYTAEELGIE